MQITDWLMAASTIIYTTFTGILIWEARTDRKNREKPHISVYMKQREDWGNFILLVITNTGQSGAKNLKFKVKEDFKCFCGNNLSELGIFKNGITYLASGEKRTISLTSLVEDFEKTLKRKIVIELSGDNIDKQQFEITFSEFENMMLPKTPPIYEIEKHLKEISKTGKEIIRKMKS